MKIGKAKTAKGRPKGGPVDRNHDMKKYFILKSNQKMTQSAFDLSLKNRFDVLYTQDDKECSSVNVSTKSKESVNKERVPPITIGYSFHEQLNVFLSKQSMKYDIKFVSIGIKLSLHTLKDFYVVCDALKKTGITFFTHQTNEQKQLKFVLKGLHSMDISILKSHLKDSSLECEDVKTMRIKKKRFDSQVNYLVYFKKGSTDLASLSKIKAINNIIVKWEYFKHPDGPTQCRRCQLYGTNHCNLPPKCVKCSGNHFTKDCSTKVDDDNKKLLKCVNCQGNHSANYGGCPAKLKYMQMRANASESKRKPKTGNKAKAPVPTNNNNNFPSLITPRRNNDWFNQFKRSPATQSTEPTNINCSDELLSANELLSITKELIMKLRSCKSALDQIEVITELAIKYGCRNV